MSFVIILGNIIKWIGQTCNIITIYLLNILHRPLIYSKYISFNANNKPWIHMEHGHSYTSKHTFVNPNISNYTL
jgi:hypothetical protein